MIAFSPTLPSTKEKIAERAWEIGPYAALLFSDVNSLSGNDIYPFVIEVRGPFPESQGVALYVVSEPGNPTNFLCAITDSGRVNYGSSDDWKSRKMFIDKAIETARKLLSIGESAKEISPPKSKELTTSRFKILPLIPIALSFSIAPFDSVIGRNGFKILDGWQFIFLAGGERLQINITIWLVQLGIGVALSVWLARAVKY